MRIPTVAIFTLTLPIAVLALSGGVEPKLVRASAIREQIPQTTGIRIEGGVKKNFSDYLPLARVGNAAGVWASPSGDSRQSAIAQRPAIAGELARSRHLKAALLKPPASSDWFFPTSGASTQVSAAVSSGSAGGNSGSAFQKIVTDVEIRFVNGGGEPFDKNGQPVQSLTRREFLLGELKLKPRQPFREELLQADVQRLRRLDLFKDVRVSLREDATGVKIIYNLQERNFTNVSIGGGNSKDVGLFTSLTYQDRNIGGVNQQFRAKVQVADDDFQYRFRFVDPYRAGEPDRLGYSLEVFRSRDVSQTFNKEIDLPNGDDVLEGRFGGSLALLRAVSEWDASLGLNYRRISLRDRDWDVARADESGHPLSASGTGIDDLVTLSVGLTRDRRNRRSNATAGSLLSFSLEQSIPVGLGDILMHRLRANYVQYLPLNFVSDAEPPDAPELAEVLAFNLQAGTAIGELPPAEAFQLGGLNSVRGYASADVASGRSFLLGSVEYRFPIVSPVGGVVFFDAGSDLGSGDSLLGEPAILRDKPGSGFGYGFGLRVKSPLGLIRGDLGISDRGDVRFEITTGQRF